MTNESDALRAELVEQKAHVARLESELLNLRQQHARDQKESLEHVRRACRERDEARVQRNDADLLYRGMADGLHKATAQREDARRIAGENFNKIVQLYAALEALSKGQTDVPHSDACEPTKKCGACKARDVVSFWRDRGNEAIAERDAARAQLLQSDRDIATAIGRARVAEAHASLAKNALADLKADHATAVAKWRTCEQDRDGNAETASASLAKLAACAWQPIATATEPSSRRIVLYSDNYDPLVGYVDLQGIWRDDNGDRIVKPTHWMPLPEPLQ